jgi:hypothetical protein
VLKDSQGSSAGREAVAGPGARGGAAAAGSSRVAGVGPAAAGMRQGSGVPAAGERQQQQQQQQLDQGPLAKQLSAQRWHQQQPSRRRWSVGGESSWGGAAASTGSAQHSTYSKGSTKQSQQVQQTLGEQASVLLQRLLYGEGSEDVTDYAAGASAGGSVLSHASSNGSRG